jgi:hypothetical protein
MAEFAGLSQARPVKLCFTRKLARKSQWANDFLTAKPIPFGPH